MSTASFSVDQSLLLTAVSPATGMRVKAKLNRIQAQILADALMQYAGAARKKSVGDLRKVIVSGLDLGKKSWQP